MQAPAHTGLPQFSLLGWSAASSGSGQSAPLSMVAPEPSKTSIGAFLFQILRFPVKVGPKRRASQANGATAEGEMTYTASPTIKAINGTTEEEN